MIRGANSLIITHDWKSCRNPILYMQRRKYAEQS